MTKVLGKGAPYGDVGGEGGEVHGEIQIKISTGDINPTVWLGCAGED
jgi:hypothetical protein